MTDKQPENLALSLRSYQTDVLAEFKIRADGDGRTVEAYAVPFGEAAEVIDQEGHYFEEFKKGAFGRQLASSRGFAGIPVFYNHGMDPTPSRRPSERWSTPIGVPVEVREDDVGLFTATRFAGTDNGDEVLQLVRDGALSRYSIQFMRTPAGGGSKRIRGGGPRGLDLVQRLDVRLIEYGPTPLPVYDGAGITGMRAKAVLDIIHELDPDERDTLSELLRAGSDPASVADDDPKHEHDAETSAVSAELLALRHDQNLRDRR